MRFVSIFLLCCCMQPALAQSFREMDTAGNVYRGLSFLDTLLQGKRIVMLGSGYNTTFASTADPVFRDPMPTWHWGREKQRMNLQQSFDAVILVNGVQVPVYLNQHRDQ